MKVLNFPDNDELAQHIEKIRRDLPNLENYLKLVAYLQKTKYDYLLEEGFSEEQAIELSKELFKL